MQTQPQDNPHGQHNGEEKRPSTTLKVAVLLILIAILVAGILLPIKLVPGALTSVSDTFYKLFSRQEQTSLVASVADITSGTPFTFTWTGKHRDNGSYSFMYECKEGVRFETSVNQPYETIPCDVPYYFTPQENSIDVTAFSQSSRFSDVAVGIGFLPNNATQEEALTETSVTVTNPTIADSRTTVGTSTTPNPTPTTPVTPTHPQPTTPSPTTPAPTQPVGPADLAVQIVGVGYIDPVTKSFVRSDVVNPNQKAAVKFQIVNTGHTQTGSWSYRVTLPSQTLPTYNSKTQKNLLPGDYVEYVLGFDNINNVRNNKITVIADPSSLVKESLKTNNTASATLINTQGVSESGKADLAVRIVSYPSRVNDNDSATIKFEVTNLGDAASGSWRFEADLPTEVDGGQYESGAQASLAAGQKKTFSITFDHLEDDGYNPVTIHVDSRNSVSESRENNNQITISIYRD